MKKLKHFPCLQILFVVFRHIQERSLFFLALCIWCFGLRSSLCLTLLPLSLCASVSVTWLGDLAKVNLDIKASLAFFLSDTPLQKPLYSEFSGRLNQTAARHLGKGITF